MTKNIFKTVSSIIEIANNTIISSIDEDGFPNLKAMPKPREIEDEKFFYFTTNTSSMRVKQYTENPKSAIYFYNARFFKGVMLKGKMEVLQDEKTKKRIWREGDEMYYPKGVSDPDYCVLKFTAQAGRVYQNFSSESFTI